MMWNNPFARADARMNQAPQVSQTGNPPGPTNKNSNADNPNSGLVPDKDNPNNVDPNTDKGDDPLLQFDNLWEPNKDDKGNPIPDDNNDVDEGFMPKIDPKKFGDLVQKMDFTRNISAEEWQGIQAGGEGAVKAMQSILNKSGRHSFATMFNAMSRMVESGFKNAQGKFHAGVPDIVRDFMTEDGLVSDAGLGPIAQNPALSPLVKGIKAQYLKKFPKATPSQVNAAVKGYFEYAAKEIAGTQKKPETKTSNQDRLRKGDAEADFMQWIEAEIGGRSQQPTDDIDQT